jgi:cephalosporin hydroxylase
MYGIDIFTRIQPHQVPILEEWRVNWAKGDSTNPNIVSVLSNEFGVFYDYVLDDGAHTPKANKLTFRHVAPFVKPGGYYIIEDVWPLELMKSSELKHDWLKQHPEDYSSLENDMFLREIESSGWKISRYDNRKVSGQPDSYVIVLQRPL